MPLLYALSDDPEVAIAEIREHYERPATAGEEGDPQDRLLADVQTMLTEDAYVAQAVTQRIAAVYYALSGSLPQIRGPLGLYVALSAATGAALTAGTSDELRAQAATVLEDDATQNCFRVFYSIGPGYDLARANLHRIGTTSLILRCPTSPGSGPVKPSAVALKCLLPRYHRVRAIRDSTEGYKQAHPPEHPSAPHVFDSTPLTIAMEFIPGDTLAERLADRAIPDDLEIEKVERIRQRALDDQDIAFIREVGLAICETLEELAREGYHHLDLSPSNIILVSKKGDPVEIKLIDFGHNFAITERVGTSAAFRRAALYVAPELVEDPSIDDWRCDAYSLGVVLLEAAAKRGVQKEDLVGELDRLWQGERPWDGAPQVARIIEELIDSKPRQRLALMDESDGENPYGYLSKLIRQETEVLALYESRTTASGFGLLRGMGLLKLRNTQLLNLFDAAKVVEDPVDDTYKDFPALAQWAVIAMACWVIALSSFATLTLADLGWATVVPSVEQFADLTHAKFEVGAFWDNLPGRLVALTFSLTAVTYYVNNFSTLSPKRLRVRIGVASDAIMRATSIGLAFPVMWAMVHDPDSWPLCAGFGTMLVVLNNFLALRIAIRADRVGSRFSMRAAGDDRFITDVFKEWWLLMGAYSLSMIAIGVLLLTGLAHDETVFAVLVIVINVAKMYRLNCVETAPQVRGCLSRDILTLRRADRLQAWTASVPGTTRIAPARRSTGFSNWWWTPTLASDPGATPDVAGGRNG